MSDEELQELLNQRFWSANRVKSHKTEINNMNAWAVAGVQ